MSIQIRVTGLVASAIVASAASAQTAIEWKVREGGNGHWYGLVQEGLLWSEARQRAIDLGGHLATTTTMNELLAIRPLLTLGGGERDYFIGASRASNSAPWSWVTGEAFTFTAWEPGAPDNGPESLVLEVIGRPVVFGNLSNPGFGLWNDETVYAAGGGQWFIVEWDADCNGDGMIDYGQILRGELIDLNANGVPDICETSISSVIPPSVPSQGGSTITIRGNFPPNPTVKVGGVVATNVNRVSVTQITATVPALLPGMASVQVNDFTLPDAIYIRPDCGSDLDQNGTVDTADISIILLDFGPCYEPPAALADPAPTPLMADEPAQKPVHR